MATRPLAAFAVFAGSACMSNLIETHMADLVTNDRKNLTRLAGEFLVASRLTQHGYMVSLQWGTTIGYDILVFDKAGHVAFLEVKSSASNPRRWALQKKYAKPQEDRIPIAQRFVCCVDMSNKSASPTVYVFPAAEVARALHYLYDGRFSNSPTYKFDLGGRPKGKTRDKAQQTVAEFLRAEDYIDLFDRLGVSPLNK